MISIEKSIFIKQPVDEVFAFASDLTSFTLWQADVSRIEQTSSGVIREGSTGVVVQKLMGIEFESQIEMTEFDAPKRACFKSTSGPLEWGGCQTTVAQDDGTLFTLIIEGEPAGLFKIAEGMVEKQLAARMEDDLERLRGLLER